MWDGKAHMRGQYVVGALDASDCVWQTSYPCGVDIWAPGLAAAALYVACVTLGENKTQRDVAEAAGVTEVTIRNRYKGLKVALNL